MANKKDKKFFIEENKRIIIFTAISIVCLITLILVSSYAVIVTRKESDTKSLYNTGNLSIKFNEDTNSVVNISNALPTSDDIGMKSNPYTFSITGEGTDENGNIVTNDYATKYTVRLVPQEGSTIPTDKIKIQINDGNPFLLSRLTDNIIESDILKKDETKTFNIRLWLDINTDTTYENSSFSAKIVVNGEAIRYVVPSSYSQVSYIESNGEQYIDTGFIPTSKTSIKVDSQITDLSEQHQSLFGAKTSNEDTKSAFEFNKISASNIWQFQYSNTSISTKTIIRDNDRHVFTIDSISEKGYIDNNIVSAFKEAEIWENESTTLYLFTSNIGGTPKIEYNSHAKLYSAKIWDKGILVRDYIPVVRINDNVPGLYDMLNRKFYENNGTGVFNIDQTS